MTTVVSRLYPNKNAADAVVSALHEAGFPADTVDVIGAGDNLEARIEASRVPRKAAATYAQEVTGDVNLVVVRAPFTPFGAAREAMAIVDDGNPHPSAVTDNNAFVKDHPDRDLFISVLTGHPLFLTSRTEMRRQRGLVSKSFGWKSLSAPKARSSAISGGRFMSKAFWPMPLTSAKKDKLSVYRGGKKFLTS